jgi:hypothetical protein
VLAAATGRGRWRWKIMAASRSKENEIFRTLHGVGPARFLSSAMTDLFALEFRRTPLTNIRLNNIWKCSSSSQRKQCPCCKDQSVIADQENNSCLFYESLSKLAKAVTLPTCIREVSCSNTGRNTHYLHWSS